MQPPQGPYQQNMDPQPQQPQWTQVPLPNQNYIPPQQPAAGQMPGVQMPPPAQIAPSAQQPFYPDPMPSAQSGPYYGQQPQQNPNQQPAARPPQRGATAQPAAYQAPNTGMPKARKKTNRGVYIALIAAVVIFALFAVLKMISPGQVAYGYVQVGPLSSRFTGDAIVVRDETVYTQEGVSQIDYVAAEGSRVARKQPVATVYSSGFSAKEWTTLNNYRNQIREYHKALISNASNDSKLLTYMTNIKERALEAQQLVQGASGSLISQEALLGQSMQDLQIYLKQKYPDDQKLTRLYDDENTQLQRISSWTKQYAAATDGMISFYTDGFESVLNMDNYGTFTPAQVRQMYNGNIPSDGKTKSRNTVSIYRVVRENPWAVLMLCNEMDWTPVTDRTYQLRIESFDNTTVWATVESFTRSGGELLIRLKIDDPSALQNVLYIRPCKVQLGESVNSLMVPSRAIYLREGRKGVVMTTEGGEYWTGVEVLSDDGQDAYIIPENAGVLYEGIRVRLF